MNEPRPVPTLAWPSDAQLTMPGSKSVANRLLIAAAVSGRPFTLRCVPASDDVRHLIAGLRTLGFAMQHDEAEARVDVGPRDTRVRRGELFCGNAGTALRFLVSLAAITPGEWVLTGDRAMQRRPSGPLVTAWRQLGLDIHDQNGCPPIRIRCDAVPRGGTVTLDGTVSSQFLSSLLLVGVGLPAGLEIRVRGDLVSAHYVDLTCRVLARRGATAARTAHGAFVQAGFAPAAPTAKVDGDWSSMGVWTCLDHLTGSRVTGTNLESVSAQPDEALAALLRTIPRQGNHTIDATGIPDQFLNLAIVAAHRSGTTRVVGGEHQRVKECDRIAVMARELRKLGVDVHELPDGLSIRGGCALRAATIDPEHDHRVAMAFALAGLLSPGIRVADPECVAKSYPSFWADLARVGTQRRCVAVVGMRGAGKTTFARAFAAATGVACVDVDELFAGEHGPIAPFVAMHGWVDFRKHEERLVAAALVPGTVVSTGGGAIESPDTRRALRERAVVVWLDADAGLLRSRLTESRGARPSVTGAPVVDEVDDLQARRRPLYEAVADVRVDAALPSVRQVEIVLQTLQAPCRWPGTSPRA